MPQDVVDDDQLDGIMGSYVIEVRSGLTSIRDLQTALIGMARIVSQKPHKRAILVLVDPKISVDRLRDEQREVLGLLRPELSNNLTIAVNRMGSYLGLPDDFSKEERERLNETIRLEGKKNKIGLRQGESYYEILKVLIHQWLRREGPMRISWLVETTGYSYPSVASALNKLDSYIVRHTNRSVELSRFPNDEWTRLLANSDLVRSTRRYRDISSQPLSPELLLRRLQNMRLQKTSVGGVFGANHYYPELDLVGSPRLDLSVHSPDGSCDLSFVQRLDPGLKETSDRRDPVKLVVHFVRRRQSFFENGPSGLVWADPVECLLDLYEAKLESQARDFLENFTAERKILA